METNLNATKNEENGYMLGTSLSLPKYLCRWWLRTRPCKNAVQINAGQGIPASVEFYVPFWAWPFEILHRAIFGSTRFNT